MGDWPTVGGFASPPCHSLTLFGAPARARTLLGAVVRGIVAAASSTLRRAAAARTVRARRRSKGEAYRAEGEAYRAGGAFHWSTVRAMSATSQLEEEGRVSRCCQGTRRP